MFCILVSNMMPTASANKLTNMAIKCMTIGLIDLYIYLTFYHCDFTVASAPLTVLLAP